LRLPFTVLFFGYIAAGAIPCCANPQDLAKRPIAAIRTDNPPTIDGDLSDPAWKSAPKAEQFVDRQTGAVPEAADQTTAWIIYDEKYLYVAFYSRDSQPESISARETVRDSKYRGGDMFNQDTEDNVEVTFDPFLSHRFPDITQFSLNAIGTRSAKIGGGRGQKSEWQGDWIGAVKRVTDGWTAEFRIPWEMLNYPRSKRPVNMGINFRRFQNRTKIQSYWSNIGPNFFNDLEGIWTGVQVPLGVFHPKISILPYILSGVSDGRPSLRSGLDARYTVAPEVTAVGSLNPDFGTIEGAVESIQFQRGERSVEERRPFFLEGSDYFRSGQGFGLGNYFYPRRIERFLTGAKLYGKLTAEDSLGVMFTNEMATRSDFVTRYRHDLSATASSSLFFLQKSAVDDNNTVGVFSQDARFGNLGVSGEIGTSSGQAAGGSIKQIGANYQDKLLFWSVRAFDVGESFRDADGFIPFTGYKGFRSFMFWNANWRHGFWRDFNLFTGPQYSWHSDGRPYQRGGGLDLFLTTRSDWAITAGVNHMRFDDQTDSTYSFGLQQGVSNRFRRWGITMITGKQADEPYSFVGPQMSLRVLKKLDVGYSGAIQSFQGRQQQHILTVGYELSPTRAFGGRVVVQDSNTNWYLSYRSSGAKGTEIYFILGDPNAERFKKTALVKLVFVI